MDGYMVDIGVSLYLLWILLSEEGQAGGICKQSSRPRTAFCQLNGNSSLVCTCLFLVALM